MEFVDKDRVQYENVIADHKNRILLILENEEVVAFCPYEAILCVSLLEKEVKNKNG